MPDLRWGGLAGLMLLMPFGGAMARGLYLETAPWYSLALADTSLSVAVGVTYVDGATTATIFPIALTPIRRGPLEFAATWNYMFVRTEGQQVFGAGDPKVFSRLRLPFPRHTNVGLYVELVARVPTADSKLFPFASGGQDVEAMVTLALQHPLGLHVGGGRILSEPPSGSALGTTDIPRATHAWMLLSHSTRRFAFRVRADVLLFEIRDTRRGVFFASVTHRNPRGIDVILELSLEAGPRSERVFEQAAALRFAMPLR